MQHYRITALLSALAVTALLHAQMTFTFKGDAAFKSGTQADGTTLITLPANTELQGCIDKVFVGGAEVSPADIVPNPTKTLITDGEIETFVYDGKAYSFRFYAGDYFTVVMFSDVHVDEDRECLTKDQFQTFVNDIINMGKSGGRQFSFTKAPKGYVPTADLVLCLGDMDKDSQKETGANNAYYTVTSSFNNSGVPFLDQLGNHDFVPDYWSGDNPDKGRTSGVSDGGIYCNDVALNIIAEHRKQAANHGVTVDKLFNDNSGHKQAEPYSFLFKGVRFYMGQTYWFEKPYSYSKVMSVFYSGGEPYAPDGVIADLTAFVADHKDEPSVWTQHYPFNFGSDCNRWWLDQNDKGKYIQPSDESAYPYTTTYNDLTTANKRKSVIASLIKQTKNAVHFSGHVHEYGTNTYSGITDYSVASPARHKGAAYIVLCKEGTGFVECKQVTFSY